MPLKVYCDSCGVNKGEAHTPNCKRNLPDQCDNRTATANSIQHGGDHYKQADGGEEHWDRVWRLGLNYFQGQVTKYVERYQKKNGIEDLKKAQHFITKLIELEEAKEKKDASK